MEPAAVLRGTPPCVVHVHCCIIHYCCNPIVHTFCHGREWSYPDDELTVKRSEWRMGWDGNGRWMGDGWEMDGWMAELFLFFVFPIFFFWFSVPQLTMTDAYDVIDYRSKNPYYFPFVPTVNLVWKNTRDEQTLLGDHKKKFDSCTCIIPLLLFCRGWTQTLDRVVSIGGRVDSFSYLSVSLSTLVELA